MPKRNLHHEQSEPDIYIRAAEARRRHGNVSHSTWWAWARRPDFPKRYRLGPGTVCWKTRELDAYFAKAPTVPLTMPAALKAGRERAAATRRAEREDTPVGA